VIDPGQIPLEQAESRRYKTVAIAGRSRPWNAM